ncbi:MAG: glucosyltransferase domain-containing protein [Lachnospiraceae bacterium]|jgi:hypothetical protein|nr:glucosyltransferase domain-containing protein [Lachnospiraceae bacterium]
MTALKAEFRTIWELFKELWLNRCYRYSCIAITLLSFITLLTHPTVGIDDTAFSLYFVDGVAPATGRWCLYLLHKVIPLGYNPYIIEFIGILIWNVSVTLWCSIFRQIVGKSISIWVYIVFACTMISSPILSELLVWYLHNGIFVAYGITALAVLTFTTALLEAVSRQTRVICFMVSVLLLSIALGFYESMMIVFLMGAMMFYLLLFITKAKRYLLRLWNWLGAFLFCAGASLLLRTVIIQLICVFFHLDDQKGILESRGLHEFFQWFSEEKGWSAFFAVMRDFFIKYYIDATVFLPITVTVLAIVILLIIGFSYAIRRRSFPIFFCVIAIILLPWVLPVLEGTTTPYRSSQYIPLLCGFAALLLFREIHTRKVNGVLRWAVILCTIFILTRQTIEMNKWFYLDAVKYEDAKQTMESVSLYIQENCDSSKPVCVIGSYEIPQGLISSAYSPNWSKRTKLAKFLIVTLFGSEVWSDYETPHGYAVAETPLLSVIEWGTHAFQRLDTELAKFCDMHGIFFQADNNPSHYANALQTFAESPSWPQKGSVVEQEDHIVVNFGI